MSRTRVEFYAMPDEQRQWLKDVAMDHRLWVIVRGPANKPLRCCMWNELEVLEFRGASRYDLNLFIGHRDLTPEPVWRTTGRGDQDIDFIKSQAVQYTASVLANDTILLDGQLAIMRAIYYEEAGINPKPLQKWFRRLAKLFRALQTPDAHLICRAASGQIRACDNIMLTPGAADWRRSGGLLKQFPDGPVEFDVEFTDTNE